MPTRKSPRLQGYDYSLPGGYFVTINAKDSARLFGEIADGALHLNEIGAIAARCWQEIPAHHQQVTIDAFVVMPNHMHGIVWLDESRAENVARLGTVIATYKAAVTRASRQVTGGELGQLWHGRYHDHIIRTNESLERIRAYIRENPARWHEDRFFAE